jgi:glyoxylase-like metal-dependent hydrolase (beta-lactamase superfamily II)
MKKVLLIVVLLIVVIIAVGGFYFWKIYQQFGKVETVQLDPQLTVYLDGGGNSIVLTSEDGSKALVVDTKMRRAAKKLRDEVKAAEITIVNTHAHYDHTGGNALYPSAKIISGAYTNEQWDNDSKKTSRYPDLALKPGEEKVIKLGSETVRIRNMGRAHTWNDVVVYCEKRKLLVTGDLVFIDMHPALYTKSGANVASWIGVLDSLASRYKIKTLIPGHGKILDQTALAVMTDYFVSIGDAIGKPDKQAELKKKYKDYFTLPGIFSFRNTTKFVEKERKGQLRTTPYSLL